MRECIYCLKSKQLNEFTLEHVLPQFFGGAYGPDELKTRAVCKSCNSNLGLFVDAGFEKDFFVHQKLKASAIAFFDPDNPTSLPFRCMGVSELAVPEMKDSEVCEVWLGSLGERLYWIREKDSRLSWYSGGNPRTTKKKLSRAYYMFSERTEKNPRLSWESFRDSLGTRKVKKLLCGSVIGANPKSIGFSDPDELDKKRIEFFLEHAYTEQHESGQIEMYMHNALRFAAKTGIGIAYCLFGKRVLKTSYADEMYKALWYRQGTELPNVYFGDSQYNGSDDEQLKNVLGLNHAVTITLLPNEIGIGVNINISKSLNWVIQCALNQDLSRQDLAKIGNGKVIVLYKHLQKGFTFNYPDFIAYKTGHNKIPELDAIYAQVDKHKDYFQSL
ncbi:HNH endonuclease [Vibrio parahaemolyticus]|uniref:HNH endonuclease n=3 Tax=Vibrio parahaemolyticus TaxID=670 RepID=UPI0015DD5B8E|nr:HNH endonuclease [Vibrio parahaemolyticus]HCG5527047.1 HNH endonuclease [Vibrio parahaemolyticus]